MRRKRPAQVRNPDRKGCSRGHSDGSLDSYADVVRDYRNNYQHRAGRDLRFFAIQRTLARTVELAALAKTADGRRQPHQRRLSASTLRRAHAELDQCDFNECRSFDELFQMVDNAIGDVHGIGTLTVYDTARRIGAHLKLESICTLVRALVPVRLGSALARMRWKSLNCLLHSDGSPLANSKIACAFTNVI